MDVFFGFTSGISSTAVPWSKRSAPDDTGDRPSKRACGLHISDLVLHNADNADIATCDNTNLGSSRIAKVQRGPFRFTKLPAELRERIYDFVFINENDGALNHDLTRLILPCITRGCPEALRRFCTTMHLDIHVQSTFFDHKVAEVLVRQSGVIRMNKALKYALRAEADFVLFRNVTMSVLKTSFSLTRQDMDREPAQILVELRVEKGVLKCSIKPGCFSDYDISVNRDIRLALDRVRIVAAKIGSRKELQGLKLADLQAIARVFRARDTIRGERLDD